MNTSVLQTPPQVLRDVVAAVNEALVLDESALFGTVAGNTSCDLLLSALATPANVAVTQGGSAGTTNYTYVVADVGNVGLAPAAGVQTTTGNATLSAANNNIVSWTGITGHTYNIYRSASSGTPSTTGLIGTVTVPLGTGFPPGGAGIVGFTTTQTFVDTGAQAGTGNVPTANTTGAMLPAGPIFSANPIFSTGNVQTQSNTISVTLTVAQVTNGILQIAGGAALSFNTPTAAALVAAFPGVQKNSKFELTLQNLNSGTVTLVGGTRVTAATSNTLTTISQNSRQLFFVFTNVTPGSEAVVIYNGPVSAF